MNCYISKNYIKTNNAGNKAKCDIEDVLEQAKFVNIGARRTYHTNAAVSFLLTLFSVLKAVISIHRGDSVVLQYPLKKYYKFITAITRLKGAHSITLIHDLGSFRSKRISVAEEMRRLNSTSCIIAHNDKMKKWLMEAGCKRPIVSLGIFDYLSTTMAKPNVKSESGDSYSILYAGGLSRRKNSFLYDLGEFMTNYSMHLYGGGFEVDMAKGDKKKYDCRGFVQSDQLIEAAVGDFGLVWDGDSIDECSGQLGEYLKYNNPHKCSLYTRCERPIIIWEQAAMADFVKENKIGICVNSLKELNSKLANISTEEYNAMVANVRVVGERVSKGYYTLRAIKMAKEEINKFKQ